MAPNFIEVEKKPIDVPTALEEKQIWELWGYNPHYPLAKYAAQFYLLEHIMADFHIGTRGVRVDRAFDEAEFNLGSIKAEMLYQIRNVLAMIIGGELRHVAHSKLTTKSLGGLRDYYNRLYKGIGLPDSAERPPAWRKWHVFTQEVGRERAASFAQSIFLNKLAWDSKAMGGRRWAGVAEAVLQYENGNFTDGVFVDTALGLHHNTNIVFDKVWPSCLPQLKVVLNDNQSGQMDNLLEIAEESWIRQLWESAYPYHSLRLIDGTHSPVLGRPRNVLFQDRSIGLDAQFPKQIKNYVLALSRVCFAGLDHDCPKIHTQIIDDVWTCDMCYTRPVEHVAKTSRDILTGVCVLCLVNFESHFTKVGNVFPVEVDQWPGFLKKQYQHKPKKQFNQGGKK